MRAILLPSLLLAATLVFGQAGFDRPAKKGTDAERAPRPQQSADRGVLPNDECTDAIPLTVGSSCVPMIGTVEGATESMPASECDGASSPGAEDVWYSFVAADPYQVVSLAAGFDAVLGLFEGGCSAPVLVLCVDQSGAQGNEQLILDGLTMGSTYYVRVHAYDPGLPDDPAFGICVVTPQGPYCVAGAANCCFETIGSVIIGSTENMSLDSIGYEDFSDIIIETSPGQTIELIVNVDNEYDADVVHAWVDLNMNGIFEASEEVLASLGMSPHAGEFTIPAASALGDLRLRVRLYDSDYDLAALPCGNTYYGQVEDYTIRVALMPGFDEHRIAAWSIFPNPGNGDLTIQHQIDDSKAILEMMDMTGRVVYREQRALIAGQQTQLSPARTLSSGLYGLRITANGQRSEQRFVVR